VTAERSTLVMRRPVSLELPRPRTGPWTLAQFGRLMTLWLIALVLLVVAWAGSRTDADPTGGGLWILLALLGGMIAGGGSTFWLVAGLRAVRAREQRFVASVAGILPGLEDRFGAVAAPVQAGERALDETAVLDIVRVDQGTLYHRADCLLVAGKRTIAVDHVDPSLAPCGVCCP